MIKGENLDCKMLSVMMRHLNISNVFLELMSSMAWVRRCYSEKSKNLNKLLVFEALYPLPGEDADLGKLRLNFAEKN